MQLNTKTNIKESTKSIDYRYNKVNHIHKILNGENIGANGCRVTFGR